MDKKLLSTAIAGALAASMSVAANADVTLFGHLDTSLDYTDISGGTDDINMNCTTCSVGVKGSEDLGNGLKAIFKLDFQFDMTERNPSGGAGNSANNAITDRDQWLGLDGGFGKIRFGTISTGYKSTGAMIDPLYRTSLQARDHGLQSSGHTGVGENGRGRMENHVRWDSPSMGGFQAIVDYSFDSNDVDADDGDDTYALTGLYNNGPILAYASYITNDHGNEDSAWKVGGSYAMGSFKVFGQYEGDDGLLSNPEVKPNNIDGADVWHLGGTFTMGNNMLYAAYGQGDDDSTAVDTGYDSWTLAATHSMSKRTMVYVGYNNIDADAGGEQDKFSLGVKHKF
ncbi:porin [Thiohalobacter sp. COW1]|uniref:Porin n=1 Tax=Thiohalobacter thiocyanaticus TaxID=585455 RepID=A0A1Z4VUH4_9GAMM|nr:MULTISPECIES: porin [Thiohalobacter]BAZ95280.1 porin [Thiohalobacter thiocyanaticus]BCO32766.1 porin [Thiohalobacter sp. COW1]